MSKRRISLTKKLDTWRFGLRYAVKDFFSDQCADSAAALTHYAVLSLFPALIVVISLLGLVGQGAETVQELLAALRAVAPESAVEVVEGPLTSLVNNPRAGATLTIGIVAALWTASGYVGAFGRAMNRIYGIKEQRSFLRKRLSHLALTATVIILTTCTLSGLVMTGPVASYFAELFNFQERSLNIWLTAKWPIITIAATLTISLLYYFSPTVKAAKFRWISPGLILAVSVWLSMSLAFGFYIKNFNSYSGTYGALAGVVIFILWMWFTNIALLLGAELDSEIERAKQLQAGLPSEKVLDLDSRSSNIAPQGPKKLRVKVKKGEVNLQERVPWTEILRRGLKKFFTW